MKPLKILMLARQTSSVGMYRATYQARILRKLGHEVTHTDHQTYRAWMKPSPEVWFKDHIGQFDLVIADRSWSADEAAMFRGFVHASPNTRMITDFDDDYHNVPWWNTAHNKYQTGQPNRVAGDMALKLSELVTVSTDHLAKEFAPYSHAIMTVPNLIDPKDWEGLPAAPDREGDSHIRILYGGASGHYGDLDEVRNGLEKFLRCPCKPVRLICLGTIPAWLHDLEREHPGLVVNLPWVDIRDYPQAVAWGGFDFAIAPLANHIFNLSKSNIKWLEAAVQGVPLLCSNVGPYESIPDGCAIKVDNVTNRWLESLFQLTKDAKLRKRIRTAAYEEVKKNWTLDSGLETWTTVLETVMNRPKILTLEETRVAVDHK